MNLATQQFIDRTAQRLALDVPQRDVDAADGVYARAAAATIDVGAVHLVPQPLRLERIFADDDLSQTGCGRV